MSDREVHVFPREIDVVHRCRQPQLDLRVRLGKPPEARYQPFSGEIGRGANSDRARPLALQQPVSAKLKSLKHVAHHGEIVAAGIGDHQTVALALEQLKPKRGLQRLDRVAHGALTEWLTAPCVTQSSSAARVKLWCRAAASNDRSAFSGGSERRIIAPLYMN